MPHQHGHAVASAHQQLHGHNLIPKSMVTCSDVSNLDTAATITGTGCKPSEPQRYMWLDTCIWFFHCREGIAARQELQAALSAAERGREAMQQEVAASRQQLQQARQDLQGAQASNDELQHQAQEWQDQAHQAASQLQVM